jgi:tRNA-dihydrouridine synthase A
VPPLQYPLVVKLAQEFPDLEIQINGGFKRLDDIVDIMSPENKLKGVMVGRMSFNNPWELRDVDRRLYGVENPGYTRREILEIWAEYGDYVTTMDPGANWNLLCKPINNLLYEESKNSKYRQFLAQKMKYQKTLKWSEFMKLVIDDFDSQNPDSLDKPVEIGTKPDAKCII